MLTGLIFVSPVISVGGRSLMIADEVTVMPASSAAEILRRFVEECVTISPGEGDFPRAMTFPEITVAEIRRPARSVTFEHSFQISRYEVTQELYQLVMKQNPSRWKGARNSAEMMSFNEAQVFCERLTAILRSAELLPPGREVRLPTEDEWEYCCRAGTQTKYSFGDSAVRDGDTADQASELNQYGWHTGNAAGNDPVVGSLKPNSWGLYDMHGYLWEFVSRPEMQVAESASADHDLPAGTQQSVYETKARLLSNVIRGGSWRDHHSLLSSSSRMFIPSYAVSDAVGFRCVISDVPADR